MTDEREIMCAMALTRVNYYNLAGLRELYDAFGSAKEIIENKDNIKDALPYCSDRIVRGLAMINEVWPRVEAEMEFTQKNKIDVLCISDERYPQRMKECPDAPIVLYYRGSADLNYRRVINIVGTRRCTMYGQDILRIFLRDLKELCPETLIVSGLAYGVDICAHRNALENGFDTVGILAHGLDYLYPPRHRSTAVEMLQHGGLLTEYMSQTNADKRNFVSRNRIVAGISDACILVESAAKGGGLLTTGISKSYNRDVFAFPGRVGDEFSEGCNNAIRNNEAALVTSAEDFVKQMCWDDDVKLKKAKENGIERSLFPEFNEDETLIVNALKKNNDQQVNFLSINAGISFNKINSILFELELKGVIKALPGGIYHLLQ